ncbi:MAG: hypothetical protein JRN17_02695 [Nitrososphaerota archaeon]|nr:hypothetical protein [Nitrososphaerota archaeon]
MLVVAFVLLRVSRRVLASYRGSAFSISRTYIYTAVYMLIAWVSLGFPSPRASRTPRAPGSGSGHRGRGRLLPLLGREDRLLEGRGVLYFRGEVIIYLVYLAALVVRLALDLAFLGPAAFSISSAPLSGASLYSAMATDVLLTFGVGLLLGRAARLAIRYGRTSRGEEQVQVARTAA